MSFEYDLNFLRFLTINISLSVFENFIVRGLFNKINFSILKRNLEEYLDKECHGYNFKDLNLYLHIPYCLDNCGYCHCAHSQLTRKNDLLEYEDFLIGQILEFSPLFSKVKMSSLYFGGGTPSLLNKESIRRIFEALFKHFRFKDNIQINFEAHPSSLTSDKLRILKEYGVNRLSLGVQSLDKEVLKAIGRIQNKEIVYSCIDNIRKMRIPYLNIDLIAGLPSQSIDSFLKDLKNIIRLKPEIIHVIPFSDISSSLYYRSNKLDIHEFVKRRHIMIYKAKQLLKDNGYKRYGFEAYQLRKGGENYQQFNFLNNFESIFSLGLYSQSMIFDKFIYRTTRWDRQNNIPNFEGRSITKRYPMANFIILHMLKGFNKSLFQEVFNENVFDVFKEEFHSLCNTKLVSISNDKVKYIGELSMEGLFEYFSYTKIFYGKEIISRLKNIYKETYNSTYAYCFHKDGFLKKVEDAFFLLTFYDIGY